jgi:hypothetical protein
MCTRARPARNGALAALAAGLPAAILADLLGMHIHTAVRWVTIVSYRLSAHSPTAPTIQRGPGAST